MKHVQSNSFPSLISPSQYFVKIKMIKYLIILIFCNNSTTFFFLSWNILLCILSPYSLFVGWSLRVTNLFQHITNTIIQLHYIQRWTLEVKILNTKVHTHWGLQPVYCNTDKEHLLIPGDKWYKLTSYCRKPQWFCMLQYLGSEFIKLISTHFLKGLKKTMKKHHQSE
jgi:hypothetical protein